uniref:ead/Ea22-like family protein n=1 Tax=Leclercia sp. EC_58 TaxID=2584090 RepID=UPI0021029E92|nr:ead/Ea22-like family protein [Leclercia sp. EC_58]
MSNINKQALRESAESTIGILENIAGFEPSDIDGDTVELRFETEDGFDTGCDVSIFDQCQKAADVVRALLDELEAAEKRIAELEARELVVNLPAYVDGRTLGYGEVNHMIDLCADAIEKAGHAAGIITKVGE